MQIIFVDHGSPALGGHGLGVVCVMVAQNLGEYQLMLPASKISFDLIFVAASDSFLTVIPNLTTTSFMELAGIEAIVMFDPFIFYRLTAESLLFDVSAFGVVSLVVDFDSETSFQNSNSSFFNQIGGLDLPKSFDIVVFFTPSPAPQKDMLEDSEVDTASTCLKRPRL